MKVFAFYNWLAVKVFELKSRCTACIPALTSWKVHLYKF